MKNRIERKIPKENMVSPKSHPNPRRSKEYKKKNQKLHPSMDDNRTELKYILRERLSSTKQLLLGKAASKGLNWSQSPSSRIHSDLDSSMLDFDKKLHGTCDFVTPSVVSNNDVVVPIPIGPLFQVEVPEWTGVVIKSDTKWLGTCTWSMEKKLSVKTDQIGKGRQNSCGCRFRDSVECVKFHVAEKRLKVKVELGLAFYHWKFDKMGEEVAFAWKEEEKKMFSCIVKSNPPSLWDEIYKYFHNKSREELVCYYFNVFLLQYRAIQNRICPWNINYDDEEIGVDAGLVSKVIQHKTTKSYTSILISSNKSQKKSLRYSS